MQWEKIQTKKMSKKDFNLRRYTDLGNRILLFNGAINSGKELIELIEENAHWELAEEIRDDFGPTRAETTLELPAGFHPLWKYLYTCLEECVNTYAHVMSDRPSKYYNEEVSDEYKDFVHISKYRTGGYVDVHTDNDVTEDGLFTMIWYLNDDYEGGEVGFVDPDITITPKSGDVLIFPAMNPHYSKEVLRGTKYLSIKQFDY